MSIAQVFECDTGRAIRLPEEFRIDANEVVITRTPEGLLVVPRDPWELFYEGIEELSDGFFREGRQQPQIENRDWAS